MASVFGISNQHRKHGNIDCTGMDLIFGNILLIALNCEQNKQHWLL